MARVTSGWQLSCSLLELLGLTMWIGGLAVILTAVIPATFNSFGVEAGGRFLRRVFDNYNALTSGIVILLIGSTWFRLWKSRNPLPDILPPTRIEVACLVGLSLVTTLIVLVLGPKAVQLQEAAFLAEGEVATKTAYEAFFRTHMIVRALHLINGGLAVGLLVVKFRQWVGRRGAFGFE